VIDAEGFGPAERLGASIAAWRADEARARREVAGRAHGPEAPPAAALAPLHEVARRHAALLGERTRADLAFLREVSAASADPLERAVAGAAAAHLARAAAQPASLAARGLLDDAARSPIDGDPRGRSPLALLAGLLHGADGPSAREEARAIEAVAAGLLPRLLARRAEADEAAAPWLAGGPPRPDLAPADADPLARARALLAATDDVSRELVARACGLARGSRELPWHVGLSRLRGADLGGAPRTRAVFGRLGQALAACAPRGALERIRVEPARAALDPRARVTAAPGERPAAGPLDVRILPSAADLGLPSALCAAEATGRALALGLAAPALPAVLRLPLDHTVARAVGVLFAQLLADPAFLRRLDGVSTREAERAGLAAATLLVVEARLCAAATCARAEPAPQRVAAAGEWIRRAAAPLVLPDELAAFLALPSAAAGARSRSRDAGVALHHALRERFDEDWWRNPRVAEALAALGARGGALSAEAALAELGVAPTALTELATRRVVELAGG
jgi:hypothetical protein